MSESKSYDGGCHCGAVKYKATMGELTGAMDCNCSICTKVGGLLTFIPAESFELLSGADDLTSYKWGKKRIDHAFCKHCGIHSFARGAKPDGTQMIAVNVKCLEGVDRSKLAVKQHDGASAPL